MSAVLAGSVVAVSRPTPGRAVRTMTRAGVCARGDVRRDGRRPARPAGPVGAGWSSMTSRAARGSFSPASQSRPGLLHRPASRSRPGRRAWAWMRFFADVPSRTRTTRWRSTARSSRTGPGAIHACGGRSARSSWARVRASTRSSFGCAEAIAVHRDGRQVRLRLAVSGQLQQPRPAVGRLGRHRRASRPPAQHFHEVRRVVAHIAVEPLPAVRLQSRDLRTLAVRVDAPRHSSSAPLLSWSSSLTRTVGRRA
jgi:hypothetical protein